ncbi:IS3 family transposase [Teredinibacter haidensis]|uniref:IS3 family transposase n=1 Tax=Teredinibacter haidensis TaxID=2731755 RepID=UPI000A8E221A|nr:IS3 family transposase [Teredinibacter haidensis]
MKYAIILEHVGQYSISLMREVLGVHRSGFCKWRDAPKSQRQTRREGVESFVKDTFAEFQAMYGAPRITKELNALGHRCSLNFVAKIMRENRRIARNGKAFNYGGHALTMHNVSDNLL